MADRVAVEVSWLEDLAKDLRQADQAMMKLTNELNQYHDLHRSRMLEIMMRGFNAKADGRTEYARGMLTAYLIMGGEQPRG